MARITKAQEKRQEELADLLRKNADAIGDAIEEFNEDQRKAWVELEARIVAFNAIIQDANTFRDEVSSDLQSAFDEKSEKWQESEAGEAYAAWMAEWETDIEEVEIDEPAAIEAPPQIDDAGDAVEAWSTQSD